MEFFGHYKKKVLWEVIDNHVVEEPTDHEEIGLRGFDLIFFDKGEEEVFREGSSELPYLIMLITILPMNWKTHLNRMNKKVDEDNGKSLGKGNVRYRKICRFSRNEFWKNIGCLISAPTFGLRGVGAMGEGRGYKDKWKEEE